MRCLRKAGVTTLDKVRNVNITSRLEQIAVILRVENKQPEWLQNMKDRTKGRLVEKVFVGIVRGKWPIKTWTDALKTNNTVLLTIQIIFLFLYLELIYITSSDLQRIGEKLCMSDWLIDYITNLYKKIYQMSVRILDCTHKYTLLQCLYIFVYICGHQ